MPLELTRAHLILHSWFCRVMSIAIGGGNSRVFRGLKLVKVVRMVRLLRLFRILKVVRLQVLAEEFMEVCTCRSRRPPVRVFIARAYITQPHFSPNNLRQPLRCNDVAKVDKRHISRTFTLWGCSRKAPPFVLYQLPD